MFPQGSGNDKFQVRLTALCAQDDGSTSAKLLFFVLAAPLSMYPKAPNRTKKVPSIDEVGPQLCNDDYKGYTKGYMKLL